MPKLYYVYILASQRRVLYVGMTSNIEQRVFQHKTHAFAGFTAKYNVPPSSISSVTAPP